MRIKDLENRDDLQLVTDSQDVEAIKDYLGGEVSLPCLSSIDGFFVKIGEGDYSEVWGFNGCVPDLSKEIYRLL